MRIRIVLPRGTDPDGRLTYHGSASRRDVLKHGGQAGRWRYLADDIARGRGYDRDQPTPRGGRPRRRNADR